MSNSRGALPKMYSKEVTLSDNHQIDTDDYEQYMQDVDYKPSYTKEEMSKYEQIVKLLPESDRQYYEMLYLQEKSLVAIAKKMKISKQSVAEKMKRIEAKMVELNKLPLDSLDYVDHNFKNVVSKRTRQVWQEYVGCYNFTIVGERLGMSEANVRKTIKRLKMVADEFQNPKIRKLVIGLIKQQPVLCYRRESVSNGD